MADEAAEPIQSDDPQGSAPPEPPADDEPRFVSTEELQARAAAFDEATFGAPPAPAEGEPAAAPAPGAETPAPTPGAGDATQALLRQNQELLEAIRSLAQRPSGVEVEDPFAAARAASPEIKQLESDITSAEETNKSLHTANNQLYQALGQAEATVLRLEGQLLATAPEDRLEVQQKYNQAATARDRIITAMDKNEQTIKNNNGQLSIWKRERAVEERNLQLTVEEKKEQAKQVEADKVATVSEYDTAILAEAAAYGIDPKSDTFGHLHRTIKADIYAFVSTRDPNSDGIDITKAVQHLFKQAAQVYNLGQRRTLAAASTTKLNNRASVAPRGTRLPAASPGALPGRPTLEQVRARRDFILSGGRG